jgi:prophage antirepressor-like protein
MPAPARINSEFEGKTLVTLTYEGRPCWVAVEIGRILGYSRDGRRLIHKINDKWHDELVEDHDYTVLRGDELEEFKASMLVGDAGARMKKHRPPMMLLFEPGLHLVLSKSGKPAGQRLRRLLLDDVLPRMTAKQQTLGHPTPTSTLFVPHQGRALDRKALREQRLMAQYELSRRVFQSEALRHTVQTLAHLGRISDDQAQSYEVLATEIALGLELPGLRIGSPFDEVANRTARRAAAEVRRLYANYRRRSRENDRRWRKEERALRERTESSSSDDSATWPRDTAKWPEDDSDAWREDDGDPDAGFPPDDDLDERSDEFASPDPALDSIDE